MGNILEVSDSNFETEILKSETPAMVDFWAEWCGPCKQIGPMVEELAAEYDNKIKIVKMDVDKNRETPAKFSIRNIPTLILFKNGAVSKMIVGAQSKSSIKEELDKLL